MARQSTSLHKSSPRNYRSHVRSPKCSFRLKRSPRVSRDNRGLTGGLSADTRYSSAQLHPKFNPVREADDEDHDDGLRYHQFAESLDDDKSGDESDGDIDMYEWDETTLYEHFLSDEAQEESEREKLIFLANQLKAPFTAQSVHLKEFVLQTFIPTAKRIKDVHAILDEKIDPTFSEGVCAVDDACKAMEAEAVKEEEDLKISYAEVGNNVKNLFTELEQAYAYRAKLWADFEADLDHIANLAIADLDTLPAKLEQVLDKCEKKSKKLDKEKLEAAKKTANMWDLLDNM